MKCVLVSHSHWDREWYRTFQSFRARLVDLVDRVLDLVAEDPGFRYLLDGQTTIVEDYLEIRPGRRADLEAACRAGRIAIGPWYVQPDSLLPSGEAHVRNLLEGRRTGSVLSRRSCRRAHSEPAARRVVGPAAAEAPEPPRRGAARGMDRAVGGARRRARRARRATVAARGLARAPPESGPRLDRRVLARPRPRADAGALRCR